MKQLSIVIGLFLVGCATVNESYAPDGRKAYTLNCSGSARGWDKCLKAAGEICKDAGYDVIDRVSEETGAAYAGGTNNGFGAGASKNSERAMMIACKPK